MIVGPITWEQIEAIGKLKKLLVKLNIKSARMPEPIILTHGSRMVLRPTIKGVKYDRHDDRDLTRDGSSNGSND